MKKTTLIIFVFVMTLMVLSNCSLFSGSTFNPPSWIIGSWTDESDVFTWEFTSDNVIYDAGGIRIDYGEMVDEEGVEIEETVSSSTEYGFSYSVSGISAEYNFYYVDSNTIDYSIDGGATYITLIKN